MPRWSRATSARSTARQWCRRGGSPGGAPCPGQLGWTNRGARRCASQQRGGWQRKWQWKRVISGEWVSITAGSQWAGPARRFTAWGSCAGREEAHSSAARCAWVEGADGSDGSRQVAYDAQRLQLECEILVEVGLVGRCDQCTNTGVLVFNELCEPCRVEVEGHARAYINGALS